MSEIQKIKDSYDEMLKEYFEDGYLSVGDGSHESLADIYESLFNKVDGMFHKLLKATGNGFKEGGE